MSVPSGHDGDDERDGASKGRRDDDPDRAAILARRQRFIALALTGLTAGACDKPKGDATEPKSAEGKDDGDDGQPMPCLTPMQADDGDVPVPDVGTPMPCLEVAPPPDPEDEPTPQACLKFAAPPPDLEDDPKPQACLRYAAPPPEDEPKEEPAKPRPCLKIAKPR